MKYLILILIFCVVIVNANARLIGGSTLRTMYINEKIKNHERTIFELENSYQKLNNYITLKICPEGQIFSTKDYLCIKCLKNFYRTNENVTCIHCPEGYFSNEGDDMCTKSPSNTTNQHTLCSKGKIIGNNKFATLGSCVKCNPNKKEYMPYMSNEDKCLQCPAGSIVNVYGLKCTPCSIGYYEQNNTCIECPIRTFTDSIGMSTCKICNNNKSFTYITSGGNNCNNSIFHNIEDIIKKNIFDIGDILKPIVTNTLQTTAIIYDHRNKIFDMTFFSVVGYGILFIMNQ
jgi:hypothetical protein